MYPVHHIGIAVTDLQESIEQYQKILGAELGAREKLADQQVELVFLKFPNTKIELLAPLSPQSTLQKFLDTRGPGLHHICYQVKDIHKELARFESEGAVLIDKKPRPGAEHTLIAFVHPKSFGGVLIELCQHS